MFKIKAFKKENSAPIGEYFSTSETMGLVLKIIKYIPETDELKYAYLSKGGEITVSRDYRLQSFLAEKPQYFILDENNPRIPKKLKEYVLI